MVKNPPAMRETWVQSLGWEDPLEEVTVTHSSILAWRMPWTVESRGSQRVGHDWVTATFTSLSVTSNSAEVSILVHVTLQTCVRVFMGLLCHEGYVCLNLLSMKNFLHKIYSYISISNI